MGGLKVGDDIIVTGVFSLDERSVQLIGTRHKITQIDQASLTYYSHPFYKVVIANKSYWVEGIACSSLIEELF